MFSCFRKKKKKLKGKPPLAAEAVVSVKEPQHQAAQQVKPDLLCTQNRQHLI